MDLLHATLVTVAMHEASHAVAGLALGRAVELVEALTRRDVAGVCRFAPVPTLPDWAERVVDAAGDVGQWAFAPVASEIWASADPANVRAIIDALPLPDEPITWSDSTSLRLAVCAQIGGVASPERVAIGVTHAEAAARRLLDWFAPEAIVLAAELVVRRTMTGRDVARLLAGMMPAPPFRLDDLAEIAMGTPAGGPENGGAEARTGQKWVLPGGRQGVRFRSGRRSRMYDTNFRNNK